MSEKNIEELMQLALKGDKTAYSRLLQETARILRPYLAKRINFAHDVEDVLQEILISIHKAKHTYDGLRPYKPWVFAIANFRLKDYLRSHYGDNLRNYSDLSEAENISDENVTKSELSYESIKEEIDKLPSKQAQILELIHNEGYTSKEVAVKMSMTESAVKVAAHRAYKVLREKINAD